MDLVTLPGLTQTGKVWLVGAGPGDPELLTVKALRVLEQAEVVLFDALVSAEIMALVPRSCETIAVGKRADKHSAAQEQINQLLVTKAATGKRVVRLKGGDPYIFGRGGEEVQVLAQANIEFEVVPGITAASGGAAYAGIPLTHRDFAQDVSFITGHCQADKLDLDWAQYRHANRTLVVYMGHKNAQIISDNLINAGRSASTPIAVIANATRPNQQVFTGDLKSLAQVSTNAPTPALIIIGDVVTLASQLSWFKPMAASELTAVLNIN